MNEVCKYDDDNIYIVIHGHELCARAREGDDGVPTKCGRKS